MTYKLFSEDYDFDTGRNAKDEQVIIGILAPDVVVLLFTDDGMLQDVIKFPSGITESVHQYDVYHDAFNDLLVKTKSHFGFVPEPVCIQQFFLEKDEIGIRCFPDHYINYLNNKDDESLYDLEAKESYERLICEWKRKNNFVFILGKDYYIDGETGEIESS